MDTRRGGRSRARPALHRLHNSDDNREFGGTGRMDRTVRSTRIFWSGVTSSAKWRRDCHLRPVRERPCRIFFPQSSTRFGRTLCLMRQVSRPKQHHFQRQLQQALAAHQRRILLLGVPHGSWHGGKLLKCSGERMVNFDLKVVARMHRKCWRLFPLPIPTIAAT